MRAGWGGKRIGAGRKRKRPRPAEVYPHPSSAHLPPPLEPGDPVEPFEPSAELTPEARAVWDRQAPHAFKIGTLTRASAYAFERYCYVSALEARAAREHAGGPDHRGVLKLLQAYEVHFALIPSGRAMADAPKVQTAPTVDPNDAFFGGASDRRA